MKVVTTGRPSLRASVADPLLEAVAPDLHVDDDRRPAWRSASRSRISSAHSASASGSAARRGSSGTGRSRGAHHVARHLDVDRQRALAGAAQHARDLGGRRGRIGQHRLVAGDLPEHRELGVDRARLVVQQEPARALARARRAGDHHHRRALRIGAGDRIDQVEGAGAVGDDRDAEAAMVARRRIGREADRRLMAQRVVRQDPAFLDHLEQRQHEIARDAEDLAGPVILQPVEQRGGERRHLRPGGRFARSLHGFGVLPRPARGARITTYQSAGFHTMSAKIAITAAKAGHPSTNQAPNRRWYCGESPAPRCAASRARSRRRIWIHTTGSQHTPTRT